MCDQRHKEHLPDPVMNACQAIEAVYLLQPRCPTHDQELSKREGSQQQARKLTGGEPDVCWGGATRVACAQPTTLIPACAATSQASGLTWDTSGRTHEHAGATLALGTAVHVVLEVSEDNFALPDAVGVDVSERHHAHDVFVGIDYRHMPDPSDPHQLCDLVNRHVVSTGEHVATHDLVDEPLFSLISIPDYPDHVPLRDDSLEPWALHDEKRSDPCR